MIKKIINDLINRFKYEEIDLYRLIDIIYDKKKSYRIIIKKDYIYISRKNRFKINLKENKEFYEIREYLFRNENRISKEVLKLLLYCMKNKKLFKVWKIQNVKGKIRKIVSPNKELKKLLKDYNNKLSFIFENRMEKRNSNQYGFIRCKSIKDNVLIHCDNKYIIKFDLKDFFDSCKYNKIKKFLYINNLTEDHQKLIKNVIVDNKTNGLMMGNPISGTISNMLMHFPYYMISNIINNINKENDLDIKFSVYADDITFSCNTINRYFNKKVLLNMIENCFEYNSIDIDINESKTKLLSNNGRRVTGLRINHLNEITIDKRNYLLMKSVFERLEHSKEITMNKDVLEGKISYYLFIDNSNKMKKLIDKYEVVLKENKITIPKKFRN